MGANATKLAQKGYSYVTGSKSGAESSNAVRLNKDNPIKATAFVLKRSSSMFFDEDGQLAHEFYSEVKSKSSRKIKLKRIRTGLTPQPEWNWWQTSRATFHLILQLFYGRNPSVTLNLLTKTTTDSSLAFQQIICIAASVLLLAVFQFDALWCIASMIYFMIITAMCNLYYVGVMWAMKYPEKLAVHC